jgi:hypothetical protein
MNMSNEAKAKTEETRRDSELTLDELEAVSAGIYMRYTMTDVTLHSIQTS